MVLATRDHLDRLLGRRCLATKDHLDSFLGRCWKCSLYEVTHSRCLFAIEWAPVLFDSSRNFGTFFVDVWSCFEGKLLWRRLASNISVFSVCIIACNCICSVCIYIKTELRAWDWCKECFLLYIYFLWFDILEGEYNYAILIQAILEFKYCVISNCIKPVRMCDAHHMFPSNVLPFANAPHISTVRLTGGLLVDKWFVKGSSNE